MVSNVFMCLLFLYKGMLAAKQSTKMGSKDEVVSNLTSRLKAISLDRGVLMRSLEHSQAANDLLLWERDMFLDMYVKLVSRVRIKKTSQEGVIERKCVPKGCKMK